MRANYGIPESIRFYNHSVDRNLMQRQAAAHRSHAPPVHRGAAERPLIDAGNGHMIRCVIPAEQLVELQGVAR